MCIALVLGLTAQAQTTSTASGGEAAGSGGTLSYSVGLVAYSANAGTNGSVTEGVQHPYEFSVATGIEEAKGINLKVTAYPNPTTDYLTLRVDKFDLSNLTFILYDINGKFIQTQKLTGTETYINMSTLVPSTYFVKILNNNKFIKIFKIVKH